jgi:hypothetical protein
MAGMGTGRIHRDPMRQTALLDLRLQNTGRQRRAANVAHANDEKTDHG